MDAEAEVVPVRKIGRVMDQLVYFYPVGHSAHFELGHPERPERVEALRQALEGAGWWQGFPHIAPLKLPPDLLSSVHTQEYLTLLQFACQRGSHLDFDTYTTTTSWQLALNSAGGAAAVAEAVWRGAAQRGLALCRPPGHHAMSDRGMGFCLLNNIALAAEYLLCLPVSVAPKAVRLAIVDLDLHHGNGTQQIFWEREDVLYISTHQSPLFPGSGRLEERGSGAGSGLTANFPLPPLTGDRGFGIVMAELILPLLDRYAPQMVLVSFGFDPHWRDPLGNLCLTGQGFYNLIHSLVEWVDQNAGGKIALCLEGGYDLQAGHSSILAATAALLGETWTDEQDPPPYPEGAAWLSVIQAAQQIWGL
jgi:acetoin utilization deacetylase AcuC-like enzyme